MLDGAGACSEHSKRLVANFPAVAVGTVEEVLSPAFSKPGNWRQLVNRSGGDQEPSCSHRFAIREGHREPGLNRGDVPRDELDAVGSRLVAPHSEEVGENKPDCGDGADRSCPPISMRIPPPSPRMEPSGRSEAHSYGLNDLTRLPKCLQNSRSASGCTSSTGLAMRRSWVRVPSSALRKAAAPGGFSLRAHAPGLGGRRCGALPTGAISNRCSRSGCCRR